MTKPKRFRFYRNKPVKRMRQGPKGIILTMVSAEKGKPGEQITVSQADWDQYGEWRELESTRMADVRHIVAN